MCAFTSKIAYLFMILTTVIVQSNLTVAMEMGQPLNVMVLISSDINEDTDGCDNFITFLINHFITAIVQKIPLICTSPIIADLKDRYLRNSEDEDTIRLIYDNLSLLEVYINKDKDFMIVLPKTGNPQLLRSLGFNEQYLDTFNLTDYLQDAMDHEELSYESVTINPSHFKNLFNLNATNPKKIYLAGHGQEDPFAYAGFTLEQYQNFLHILSERSFNTQLLYISSCFSGGKNMLIAHNLLTDYRMDPAIYFPIVVEQTDAVVAEGWHGVWNKDFMRFFSDNDLMAFYRANDTHYHHLPWLYQPGNRSFKPVDIDPEIRLLDHQPGRRAPLKWESYSGMFTHCCDPDNIVRTIAAIHFKNPWPSTTFFSGNSFAKT